MIVVDTNVLAYLYLPGEHSAIAEALLERESLDGAEVKALIEGRALRPFQAAPKGDSGSKLTQEVIRPESGVRMPPGLIDGERPQPA